MAYKFGGPNPASAANNPREAERMFANLLHRLDRLEKATSHLAANPTTQSPEVTIPPSSQLQTTAKPGTGRMTLAINLPQFINPPAGKSRNQSRAAIYHQIDYATDETFSQNLVSLPPTTQTVLPIVEEPNSTLHVRVRSSYDGKHFGPYIRSGPVKL